MQKWLSGNMTRLREECREVWTFALFERLYEDFRYSLRTLFKNPTFAAASVLTLALGVGANTAVFSIVRGVMLRPLPYHDPDRLVFVTEAPSPGMHQHGLTGNDVTLYKSSSTFEDFAVTRMWGPLGVPIDLLRSDGSERLIGSVVTSNLFSMLGVKAAIGRTFAESDSQGEPLAILSHALWRRTFGANPAVIGQTVRLAQLRESRTKPPFTVIGVLPEDFRFQYPKDTDVFLLLPQSEVRPGGSFEFGMVARLKPGVTSSQASRELTAAAKDAVRLRDLPPALLNDYLDRTVVYIEPMAEHMKGNVRDGMLLIAGVAGLFLLMSCVNIGLLIIARTVDRSGELALRCSLGGTRSRILRQLITEGCTIAAFGGILGLLAAAAALPLVRSLLPPNIPRVDQISVDGWVLGFALAASSMTAVVCGLAPFWIAARRDLLDAMRRSSATVSSDRKVSFIRSAVIGSQVAMVPALVVVAALLLQSFWRLQNVDLGFNAGGVITMEMRLLDPKYRQEGYRAAFQENLLSRVRQVPGVLQASITTAVPMRGVDFTWVLGPRGGPRKAGNMRSVDPDFFHVMQIPLKAGRFFTSADDAGSKPVMIVSESYGRAHFGGESPLGKMIEGDRSEIEIVGVVGDVRSVAVFQDAKPAFYLPRTQEPSELMCLVVKPQPGAAGNVVPALRDAIRAIDADQPVEGITTIGRIVDESTADRRFYAVATGAFASVGLLLAMIGLFGVVSRAVSERRRELAIRAALGADPARLAALIFRLGLTPAVIGALAGLGGAYAGSRLLRSFVFQVAPTDPWTYSSAALLVIISAIAACLIPALHALRTAPMVVLKSD